MYIVRKQINASVNYFGEREQILIRAVLELLARTLHQTFNVVAKTESPIICVDFLQSINMKNYVTHALSIAVRLVSV